MPFCKNNKKSGKKVKINFFRALKINQKITTILECLFKKNWWISINTTGFVAFKPQSQFTCPQFHDSLGSQQPYNHWKLWKTAVLQPLEVHTSFVAPQKIWSPKNYHCLLVWKVLEKTYSQGCHVWPDSESTFQEKP